MVMEVDTPIPNHLGTETISRQKEKLRSKCFRLSLSAVINDLRHCVDSQEVPAMSLCKNKVLLSAIKYLALKDVIMRSPQHNHEDLSNMDHIQSTRCLIAFDNSLEIHYASNNIELFLSESQSSVLRSSMDRYLMESSIARLRSKCINTHGQEVSIMVNLKRSMHRILLKGKCHVLKTRLVFVGTGSMCSEFISSSFEEIQTFFLDTRWSLYELFYANRLSDSHDKPLNHLKAQQFELVKFVSMFHGYFSIDIGPLGDGHFFNMIAKGVTVYSEDDFPLYIVGKMFSFDNISYDKTLLQKADHHFKQSPYPLGCNIGSERNISAFIKIYCNYVQLKFNGDEDIKNAINELLDVKCQNNFAGIKIKVSMLEKIQLCFDELRDIYNCNNSLWQHLRTTIGYTVNDIVIKDVQSLGSLNEFVQFK